MTPLKRLLFERGHTTRWLAKQSGVSEVTLSLIINGKRVPTLENALRIAEVLEVTVEELWGYVIRGDKNADSTE